MTRHLTSGCLAKPVPTTASLALGEIPVRPGKGPNPGYVPPVTVFSDLTEARNCVRARIGEPEGIQKAGRVFDSGYV